MLKPAVIIYDVAIRFYTLGIFAASFFNAKARQWWQGRREPIPIINKAPGQKVVWFHCASLGEFEQARPLIEKVKQAYPQHKIVLTFFSPSGYNVRKNYPVADVVGYLPVDTRYKAAQFISAIKPDVALFVKYDLWYHHLKQLQQRGIPVILFSAIFRPQHVFFKWYGWLHRYMLGLFSAVFVQNAHSQKLLQTIGVSAQVAPDTRFDRVAQIAAVSTPFTLVEQFKGNSPLLVAGSTWPADEALLLQVIQQQLLPGYKYVIAPHNLNQPAIDELIKQLPVKAIRLTQLNAQNAAGGQVLVIDSMGQLAQLYRYAHITYVGGGFNSSVHNVLEPAVYGVPVIFGPHNHKAAEALQLIQLQAGFVVTNYATLAETLTQLNIDTTLYQTAARAAGNYVAGNTGGTIAVFIKLQKLL